jgi:AraC-like DNA-binding protein
VLAQVAVAVQDSLDSPWTLSSMAAMAGYEVHHFAHAFTAAIGQPPRRYVRGLRLERAAHELTFSPEKGLPAVATEAGYSSYEAFRRAFVREFGVPPGAARRLDRSSPRGRPSPRDSEPAGRPPSCVGGPWIEKLGPLRGVSFAASSFSDEAIAMAWRGLISRLPAGTERRLGAAVSPWGWLAPSRRPREYRCLALDARLPLSPGLARWTLPASWHARFDFHGPTAGMHDLFRWVFAEWLPRSALRCTFAPTVTIFDERAWHESGYSISRAQIHLPVRKLQVW